MGFLVSMKGENKRSYSGTEYVNPTNGTKRLCLRTGTGKNDVIRYGLTTNSSASNYCGMKMKIDGNTAYIGRSEPLETAFTTFSSSLRTSLSSYSTKYAYYSSASTSTKTTSGTLSYVTTNSTTSFSRTSTFNIDGKVRSGTDYVSTSLVGMFSASSLTRTSGSYKYTSYRYTTSNTTFETHSISLKDANEADNFNL